MTLPSAAAGPEPATPVPVLYMIGALVRGGAEHTVATLVRGIDRAAFAPRVVVFRKIGDLVADVEAHAPLDELPVRILWSPTGARRTLELARRLRRDPVAIIHSFGYGCDVMAAIAGRLARVPWIVTTRRSLGVDKPAQGWVYRATNRLAHRVLAVSHETREWSIRHERLDPGKIETIPNAVDVGRFSPGPPASRADGVVRIGTVGNVRPVKGADLLLEAFAEAVRALPDVPLELHLAGRVREDVRPELERALGDLGIADRVHLEGEIEDVAGFLRRLDVFALPSHREGMSNAVLEALATGLPVVATAVGGNLENVREGEGGYLVRARSVADFAAALITLARDPERRERFGRFNRTLAVEEYSLERVIQATESYYRRLLAERPFRSGT